MSEARLVRCPSCGATNRVPLEKVAAGLRPICGRCKAPMPIDLEPLAVTDATFAADVERSPLPVLLDFWAPWCGPCQRVGPMIDELATALAGRVRVAKLNVDESPATASRFGVEGIPTLLLLDHGREVDRLVGVPLRDDLLRRIDRAFG